MSFWLLACGAEPRREPAVASSATVPEPQPAAAMPTPEPAATPPDKPPVETPPAKPEEPQEKTVARPPGFVELSTVENQYEPRRVTCGAYQVDVRAGKTPGKNSLAIVDAKGKDVRQFAPANGIENWYPSWCFDVTGDGVPELLVTGRSMGAHCCYKHTVVSLTTPLVELVTYDAGNGSGYAMNPVNIDSKGAFELVDTDDTLTVIGSAPYVSARFLPVVFAYEKGKYVRATRKFKSYLEQERSEVMKSCKDGACWEEEDEYLLGLSLLIGDWDAFKRDQKLAKEKSDGLEPLRKKLVARLK